MAIQYISKTPSGATIETAYVGREVKVYGVLESEVRMITVFNTLSTTFFSLSASVASIAIGIWTNAAYAGAPTAAGTILSGVIAPGLCALSLIFLAVAIWARMSRGTTWSLIQQESKQKI